MKIETSLFKVSVTVALLASVSLSGCDLSAIEAAVTTDVQDVKTVAAEIDAGAGALATAALPGACAAIGAVYTYGSELQTLGLVPSSTQLKDALAVADALYTNPICTTALAGGTVASPGTLLQDIASAVAAVKAATSGKVTATAAVTAPVVTAPATASLVRKLNRKVNHTLALQRG